MRLFIRLCEIQLQQSRGTEDMGQRTRFDMNGDFGDGNKGTRKLVARTNDAQ